jgi:hypothetical protein
MLSAYYHSIIVRQFKEAQKAITKIAIRFTRTKIKS